MAAGTVASLRDYRGSTEVWISGLALASTTGYLRIAADRHYATDVLAGAVLGSLIGWGVPRLLDLDRSDEGEALAGGSSILVPVVAFRF